MHSSSCKRVAVFMIAIYLAVFWISTVQSKGVEHTIEHALHHVSMSVVNITDIDTALSSQTNNDHENGNVVAHKLLHAVDNLQTFPYAVLNFRVPKNSDIVLPHFASVKLPTSIFATPFRPPRHTSLAI